MEKTDVHFTTVSALLFSYFRYDVFIQKVGKRSKHEENKICKTESTSEYLTRRAMSRFIFCIAGKGSIEWEMFKKTVKE